MLGIGVESKTELRHGYSNDTSEFECSSFVIEKKRKEKKFIYHLQNENILNGKFPETSVKFAN